MLLDDGARSGAQQGADTEEVGALNGTFVNGTKLTAGEAQPLSEGDRVSLGMVKMICRTEPDAGEKVAEGASG